MNEIEKTLDEILARLFITTLKIEERVIASESNKTLSISELHVLREIGIGKTKTMSQVAEGLKISVGALTTAVNKLERKGLVVRSKNLDDKRIVHINLTEEGIENFKIHDEFHRQMVDASVSSLSDEEKVILLKSLTALDEWFISEWRKIQEQEM